MSTTFVVDQNLLSHHDRKRFFQNSGEANMSFLKNGLKNLGVKTDSIEAFKFNNQGPMILCPAGINAFVDGCMRAFNEHMPIVFGPDEIWILILQAFSLHIQQNAEELRHLFVKFEGKQKLTVYNTDFVKGSGDNDWPREFNKFSDLIAEHLGKKRDLFDASFSTTTSVEKAAVQVQMMSAMSSYFEYGMHTLCGVPTVTLLGTVEDWQSILRRAMAAAEFYPAWALDPLVNTLNQFCKAAEGQPDVSFWKSFFKTGGGSGGPYISGHINSFFPYLTSYKGTYHQNRFIGKPASGHMGGGPTQDQFPSALVAVPMEWKIADDTFNMKLVTGVAGITLRHDEDDSKPDAYRMVTGWAVGEAVGSGKQ